MTQKEPVNFGQTLRQITKINITAKDISNDLRKQMLNAAKQGLDSIIAPMHKQVLIQQMDTLKLNGIVAFSQQDPRNTDFVWVTYSWKDVDLSILSFKDAIEEIIINNSIYRKTDINILKTQIKKIPINENLRIEIIAAARREKLSVDTRNVLKLEDIDILKKEGFECEPLQKEKWSTGML